MREHDTERLGEEQAKVRPITKPEAGEALERLSADIGCRLERDAETLRRYIEQDPNAEAIRVLEELRKHPDSHSWNHQYDAGWQDAISAARRQLDSPSISWDDVPVWSEFEAKSQFAEGLKFFKMSTRQAVRFHDTRILLACDFGVSPSQYEITSYEGMKDSE